MQISHQAPAEARTQALFHAFEIGRALVGGDDDLAVLIDQRVEGVEEFFLRGVAADDELDVVDHQNIDRAELFLEGVGVLVTQGAHKLVHEAFGGEVDDLTRGILDFDLVGDGVHQVVLPKPTAPYKKRGLKVTAVASATRRAAGVGELV